MYPGIRRTALAVLAIFAVNAFVVRELFFLDYTAEMGSIEAAYISISRYITENWTELTWFPLWYGGIPFQNTYPPLLHLAVAGVAEISGWSAGRAHHFVTALAYCLGPITLFWLALRLSGDRSTSALAAVGYSVISASALLIPVVARDMGGAFYARRFQALVHYGEGPHVTSMMLLPVAIVCLDLAYKRRSPVFYMLAAVSLAAVVLTNWIGGFALAAAVASYLLANRTSAKGWAGATAIGLYAYVLASPWIPPSTLTAIRTNAQRIGGPFGFSWIHVLYAVLFLAALAGLHFLLLRMQASRILHFSALFFLFMGAVTLSAEWFGIFLLPQPQRYHLEMEIGIVLFAAFGARAAVAGRPRLLRLAVVALIVGVGVNQLLKYRWYAKHMLRPVEITQTTEYKIARWFDQNMSGRRVMAPGTVSFWMNAFTDTPQIGGGFDQGITNQILPAAQFQIYSGMGAGEAEGEVAVTWLKALGVHAVAIGGEKSGEYYKPFRNPHKFEGLLKEMWREGDDRIFEIPQRSISLARVVESRHIVRAQPETAANVDLLKPYVAALDDPALPQMQWTWHNRHSAAATGRLSRGQILSIQIAYHPGWIGSVNGRSVSIEVDAIGQMVIDPRCDGECTLDLRFTGGREAVAARFISYAGLLGGLVWIAVPATRRRFRPASREPL